MMGKSLRNFFALFFTFLCYTLPGISQQAQLSGAIIDSTSGAPLPGANIIVEHLLVGTAADDSGRFKIQLPPGKFSLKISHIGYQNKSITVTLLPDQQKNLMIGLIPESLKFETVIVEAEFDVEKHIPQQMSLSSRLLTELPLSTPDLFQSVKKLPGVATVSDKSAEFNVRGSHFDEHLSMIEGIPIGRPFHLKAGSLESISIINSELIDHVEFYPGSFPARYGWKMSSAMNIKYRQGSREKTKTTVNLNSWGSNIVVEGPVKKNNGNWIIGVRKSYINYWLKKIRPFESGQGDYWDIQGHVRMDIGSRTWIDLIGIFGKSAYEFEPSDFSFIYTFPPKSTPIDTIHNVLNGIESNKFNSGILIGKLTYQLSDDSQLRFTQAFYKESDNENADLRKTASDSVAVIEQYTKRYNSLAISKFHSKLELEFGISEKTSILSGFEYFTENIKEDTDEYLFEINNDNFITTSQYISANNIGQSGSAFFTELIVKAFSGAVLYPGLRLQYDKLTGEFVMNRSVNFLLKRKGYKLYGGTGIFYQPPMQAEFRRADPEQPFRYFNQKNYQVSTGVEWDRKNGGKYRIEGFYKSSPSMLPYIFENGYYKYRHGVTGKSRSWGFDATLSGYMAENVFGMVDYGYLDAQEKLNEQHYNWIPRSTDRRHTVKLGMIHTVNPESGYKFIFNFTVGTGYPYTIPNFGKTTETDINVREDGPVNRARYRSYRRLDIRWSRELKNLKIKSKTVNGEVYFEILNIWDIRNTIEFKWDNFGNSGIVKRPVFLTPRMVGFGVKLIVE